MDKMQVDRPEDNQIDESLYSRQIYVLGKEAMVKMQHANVLIIGLKGLGVEIAKNVALAGVKSISLYDPELVTVQDLSTQFFLSEDDVGKPRALACCGRLAELNSYVPISVISEISEPTLKTFKVIVNTTLPLDKQLEINEITHKNDICYISADTKGLFAQLFVDFGEKFTVIDQTGEEPKTGIVSDLEKDGTVSTLDDNRHGLEDGDFVKFSEVKGIEVNEGLYKVEVLGPYAFKVDLTGIKGEYKKGGIFTQVKVPKEESFEPLSKQLESPTFCYSDFAKFDHATQLHAGYKAIDAFVKVNGFLPRPQVDSDAQEVVTLARKFETEVNEKIIKELAFQATGDLPGVIAFVGGFIAQEVLKGCSGKFTPMKQFMYFDSLESLPKNYARNAETCKPIGSRYDGQIAVFGIDFQQAIANLKVFLVGTGAIGCEMLKNWSMMGLGSGPEGKITITDPDSIEKSNLNRQFLFRPKDVGRNKSECAAAAVAMMNPHLTGKIECKMDKVGTETEDVFNDSFWSQFDIVTNALDNVEARTYVDRRCVFFRKPLLESGTLGTKGNTQVVVPNLTESYSSSQDPPEKSIPLCTLRSFPNKIDHTIAWAKSLFLAYFQEAPENVNMYLTQPDFVESSLKQSGDVKGVLESISRYLNGRPYSFEDCIKWARLEFEDKFNHEIQQLLYNFPEDATTSSGAPFWSGPKRAPTPLVFSLDNRDHLHFIAGGANLLAFIFGLKGDSGEPDVEYYQRVLSTLEIPEFSPKSGVKIQVNENEPDPNESDAMDSSEISQLASSLPPSSSLAGFRLTPAEFEKDDDTNHHIEFITSASNCRALNYAIDTADYSKTKFIAGRIIPAIATTTALVTGLVCLELYKVADGNTNIEDYKNGFINLALPFVGFSEPIKSPQGKYNDKTFDQIWSRFDIYGDITLQQLLDKFENDEGLTISMLSYGVSLLYASFHPPKKLKDRLPMKLTHLIETVSKKKIPDFEKSLIFEICAEDKEEEDVEVPYICVHI